MFEGNGPATLSSTVTYYSALVTSSVAKIPGQRSIYVHGTTGTYSGVWTAPFGQGSVLYVLTRTLPC